MKEIITDVYHVGSSGCDVYLVDTKSSEGLVLIDCGMDISLIRSISEKGLNPANIEHCIITHCHIDHIAACHKLLELSEEVKFYAHVKTSETLAPFAVRVFREGTSSKKRRTWSSVSLYTIQGIPER